MNNFTTKDNNQDNIITNSTKQLENRAKWRRLFYSIMLALLALAVLVVFWKTLRADNLGFSDKTLWNWMELLIIPSFLAIAAYLLNKSQKETEMRIVEKRQLEERQIAKQRAIVDRELADDQRQQAVLDAYFDRIATLLIDKELSMSAKDDVRRSIARTWTLTVLREVNESRKSQILQFLYESSLIGFIHQSGHLIKPIIEMEFSDLRKIDLQYAKLDAICLQKANLREANFQSARLIGANFYQSDLDDADLSWTDLRGADLRAGLKRANLGAAHLDKANLDGADLNGASLLNAQLVGASLRHTNLKYENQYDTKSDVMKASLWRADLTNADLTGAKVDKEQLMTADSLKGATMPDGTKFEEWIQLQQKSSSAKEEEKS